MRSRPRPGAFSGTRLRLPSSGESLENPPKVVFLLLVLVLLVLLLRRVAGSGGSRVGGHAHRFGCGGALLLWPPQDLDRFDPAPTPTGAILHVRFVVIC